MLQSAGDNRIPWSAGVTQLVECDLAKVDVAGSNPVSRSKPHANLINLSFDGGPSSAGIA